MSSFQRYIISFSLLVITLTTSIGMLHGQQQSNSNNKKNSGQEPIVDYESSQPFTNEEEAKRKAKDGHLSKKALAESPDIQVFTTVRGDWLERLPSFPVSLSDYIIIGSITDSKAYLSANKTGIFSEFSIQIQETLKQDSNTPLVIGSSVVAEREGGRVRYPSGHIQRYVMLHQGMPVVGNRYVFFLRKSDQLADTVPYILTGYELRSGRVFPIDGVDGRDEEKLSQFSIYEGADENSFLSKLHSVIAQSTSKERK